jgi:hypothetical protein
MDIIVKILSLIILLLCSGCIAPEPTSSSAIITIKSDNIRLNDTAFIEHNLGGVKVEVYKAGQLALVIENGQKICLNAKCMKPKVFVKNFIHPTYPAHFIHQLFAKEELDFEGSQITQNDMGFIQQSFKKNSYNITYRVSKRETFFRDSVNKIIFRIKEIP